MSEFESPQRVEPTHRVTVEDVRELTGAATPHFALQIRNRLLRLVSTLPDDDSARILANSEATRLEQLAVSGENRGAPKHASEQLLRDL
ncbi:MAG: hypothetical protein JHC87_02950 [Thermoleophilaceae bacterium]|nr:hypothetical protein [Thermoleophilaceae bacterium]